jgi:diphosphomevalonate decarboxylase
MSHRTATARAHANIALAKYWGKANATYNIPAVPSVSVTLRALSTTTTVAFDDALSDDEVIVGGVPQEGRPKSRVCEMLDRVRAEAGHEARARVASANDFPTASGLASSASAFAALALASVTAAGLDWDTAKISDLARRSSASAGRSLFGGFVRLAAGTAGTTYLPAEPIAPSEHWDLRIIVAVISEKPKAVSSTQGMNHTVATSPYFDAWVRLCPTLARTIEEAIAERDMQKLGEAAEHSALAMHASALAAAPGVIYFEPATLETLHAVRAMRGENVTAYATMDAGPHVKVITTADQAEEVVHRLEAVPGVLRTISSQLGGPASVTLGSSQ